MKFLGSIQNDGSCYKIKKTYDIMFGRGQMGTYEPGIMAPPKK